MVLVPKVSATDIKNATGYNTAQVQPISTSLSLCVRSILVLSFHLSSLLHGFATEIMSETKMLFSSNFSYFIIDRHSL